MTAKEYNAIKGLVFAFVGSMLRENHWVDKDELVSDAWLVALEARRRWRPNGGRKFSSFLAWKLERFRCNLIRSHVRARTAEQELRVKMAGLPSGAWVEPAVGQLATAVRGQLSPTEGQILDLMLSPTAPFREFLAGKGDRHPRRRRSPTVASQATYAKYLWQNPRTVSRTCRKIDKLLRELLDEQA